MLKKIILIIIGSISFSMFSCGEGVVEVTNESYEPKIAIEGYLIADQKVDKIRISRNFPVNANLTRMSLLPDVNQTDVTITDLSTNSLYNLTFHVAPDDRLENYYWQNNSPGLTITPGKSYRLDVTANVDGQQLQASAITTVPDSGFSIAQTNYNQLPFREKDHNGKLKEFEVTINRSAETTFYLATLKPLNASTNNFIYDHPFYNEEPEDLDIEDYDYVYGWIQDTPTTPGQSSFTVFWVNLWFYDIYEVVVYATDDNYKEFVQTYNDVQEPDGNFHEAKFNIEGDGIGVFGSMIADTVNIEVLRN